MVTLLATLMLAPATRASSRSTAWLLIVCIAALLGTHLTRDRLANSSFVPLLVRLLLFPTVFFLSGSTSFGIDWIFEQQTTYMLGQILAIEGCLQHWRHQPSAARGRFPLSGLLLWCLVYLSGSNVTSYWGSLIVLTTPLFMLLLGWSLLSWKPARLDRRAQGAVLACWAAAIAGGFGLHTGAMVFKNELMNLGSQLMREGMARMVAGVSNRPKLESSFDIPDSQRRLLRVEGELSDPHLRAASFDTYDHGGWDPSLSQRADTIDTNVSEDKLQSKVEPQSEKSAAPATPKAATSKVRITRVADINDEPLFVPLNSVGIRALDSADVDGPTYDFERSTGLLRCGEPNPFAYEVTESTRAIAGVPVFQGPLCEPRGGLTGRERRKYLQLPTDFDARVVKIAKEATRGDGTPAERAQSIARLLLSTHKYSREILIKEGTDPIAQFIVGKKDAHCQFFASALVLMCRSVKVPARYVIGYLAHEAALGEPGVINVRQRDAHAWAEVWIDGVGWVAADATPGDGRPEARGEVAQTQKWGEWASDLLTSIRNRAARIPRNTWGWIIGLPLALWLVVRGRPQAARRRAQERAYAASQGDHAERLEALAREFERWMAAQKLAPLPSRSWPWFLQREQRERAALWARDYEAARFGLVTPQELERLESELHSLRQHASAPSRQ